jgi:uridine monophosphate synthetase
MPSFIQSLEARASESNSLLCVGLDPHVEAISEPTSEAAREFCLRLIDACAPYTCAFKPNSAFFERYGAKGMAALREVIAAVPTGIPVILDAKRGDIASTAEAYAHAVFDTLNAHALTASPYLGADSLAPFLHRPERGVFVLCKTTNPGADELQALRADGEPFYLHVARKAQIWSRHENLGLVVGATDPHALARVRAVAPDLWFLAPGVGAQGANLDVALQAGLRPDGMGMLVSASRSIAGSADPAAAAANLRESINSARRATGAVVAHRPCDGLAASLLDSGCVRFGEFTLKSGERSPFYIDLRRLASFPDVLRNVAAAFATVLNTLDFDCIAAIPYAALSIGTAVALAGDWPLIYPRREVKEYGTGAAVEGVFRAGDTAVVLDDLITTGETKFETIEKLQAAGLQVRDVVVLIDREQGAMAALAGRGFRLHAVVTVRELMDIWREQGAISAGQYQAVLDYLSRGH